ncbi:unnamed protein product [Ambrosiozyma monospora]|uniref:Unnamed protein product n=1 Tax=Ambrosiozyma monospora TaxID=43982 RepID=A0ACB5SZ94_AMBMO|nr:unnamed protein product [Ambrosiozyma monospora]
MYGMSKKEIKIISLLLIDTIFFFIEIIVGYAVNSLALIADSFHMLNDIISLIVALWAVNVAKNKEADSKFTYGWQRAEILGALINAVFLLALCFSIFIEAIQRFIMPQEITNAKLILFVGSCGLISNFVGLFLFHDHGHSHGGSGGHSHADLFEDEEANIGLEPEHSHSHTGEHSHSHEHGHSHADEHAHGHSHGHDSPDPLETSGLDDVLPTVVVKKLDPRVNRYLNNDDFKLIHGSHNHVLKKDSAGDGHTKSMNMQGVFLHVMGDALGNIGVMATALFIWKTDYSWRFYTDPLISLVITCIIFSSALPLCKSSSRILLQGTPLTVDFNDVKDDILTIPGVLSVHDFHIWNLTERLLIASLHVDLSVSPEEFLTVASTIKGCLHEYGIHSATIQPEFSNYYAQKNILPTRYASREHLPQRNGSTHSKNSGSGDETARLLDDAESATYGTTATTHSDNSIHCIVDAATGCTTADCVK